MHAMVRSILADSVYDLAISVKLGNANFPWGRATAHAVPAPTYALAIHGL